MLQPKHTNSLDVNPKREKKKTWPNFPFHFRARSSLETTTMHRQLICVSTFAFDQNIGKGFTLTPPKYTLIQQAVWFLALQSRMPRPSNIDLPDNKKIEGWLSFGRIISNKPVLVRFWHWSARGPPNSRILKSRIAVQPSISIHVERRSTKPFHVHKTSLHMGTNPMVIGCFDGLFGSQPKGFVNRLALRHDLLSSRQCI